MQSAGPGCQYQDSRLCKDEKAEEEHEEGGVVQLNSVADLSYKDCGKKKGVDQDLGNDETKRPHSQMIESPHHDPWDQSGVEVSVKAEKEKVTLHRRVDATDEMEEGKADSA